MDIVTQAILGAACGQIICHRRLGKKALFWGAIGGIIPDLDIFIRTSDPFSGIIYHRGFTHSLFFAPLVSPLLGSLLWKFHKHDNSTESRKYLKDWILLLFLSLITHPLLDVFTTYGTQLLSPFSNHRFALHAVAIVDPFYTIPLLLPILWAFRDKTSLLTASRSATTLLILTTGYLLYTWYENQQALRLTAEQLSLERVTATKINAYPTMFQPYLRRIVIHTPQDIRIGYLTTWSPQTVNWHIYPSIQSPLIDKALNTREGRLWNWFTAGDIFPRLIHNPTKDSYTIELRDLRYGLPGESLIGMWSIQATFKSDGAQLEPFRWAKYSPKIDKQSIKNLLLASLGYSSPYFSKQEDLAERDEL
ncbi:MAG: LexA-binding, inner rane-associated putative hydrolase [Chlamydiales bacterium]|jgi:inner membrane protein|nr:LexA-binding, inner rane-associated putative hydrolase [Chlamydiales bacterium]